MRGTSVRFESDTNTFCVDDSGQNSEYSYPEALNYPSEDRRGCGTWVLFSWFNEEENGLSVSSSQHTLVDSIRCLRGQTTSTLMQIQDNTTFLAILGSQQLLTRGCLEIGWSVVEQIALQAHLRRMRQQQSVSFVTSLREKYLASFGSRGRLSVRSTRFEIQMPRMRARLCRAVDTRAVCL